MEVWASWQNTVRVRRTGVTDSIGWSPHELQFKRTEIIEARYNMSPKIIQILFKYYRKHKLEGGRYSPAPRSGALAVVLLFPPNTIELCVTKGLIVFKHFIHSPNTLLKWNSSQLSIILVDHLVNHFSGRDFSEFLSIIFGVIIFSRSSKVDHFRIDHLSGRSFKWENSVVERNVL